MARPARTRCSTAAAAVATIAFSVPTIAFSVLLVPMCDSKGKDRIRSVPQNPTHRYAGTLHVSEYETNANTGVNQLMPRPRNPALALLAGMANTSAYNVGAVAAHNPPACC